MTLEVADTDPVSEDLLLQQTGILERYHWFVRSHLEDYAGGMSNAGAKSEIQAARAVATKAVSAGRSSRSNGSRRAAG